MRDVEYLEKPAGETEDEEKRDRCWAWLFTCHRWDELLSAKSDISRRSRTMSSIAVIGEVRKLARSKLASRGETQQGETPERAGHGIHNLGEVLEEASEIVGSDPVLAEMKLKEPILAQLDNIKADDFGDTEVDALMASITQVRGSYIKTASRVVETTISKKPKCLNDLDRAISALIAEARTQGWSDQSLRAIKPNPMASSYTDEMERVSGCLSSEKATFICLVEVNLGELSQEWLGKRDFFTHRNIDKERVGVEVKIDSLDEIGAARSALAKVAAVLGAASVYTATPAFPVTPSSIIVRRENSDTQIAIPTTEPFEPEQQIVSEQQISDLAERIWTASKHEGYDPLHQALRLQERARRTSDVDTRFILLWFGIESLLAGSLAYAGRIEKAARKLIPGSLTLSKIRRDLSAITGAMDAQLDNDCLKKLHEKWGVRHTVLQKTVVDRNRVLESLLGNEQQYQELRQILLQARQPTLVHWLKSLRSVFKPSSTQNKSIADYIEDSYIRTERQVCRLYRARNGMAHGGSTPELLHDLIRHANFYLTNLIAIVAHERRLGETSLPAQIFSQRAGHLDAFLKALRSGAPGTLTVAALERPNKFNVSS